MVYLHEHNPFAVLLSSAHKGLHVEYVWCILALPRNWKLVTAFRSDFT